MAPNRNADSGRSSVALHKCTSIVEVLKQRAAATPERPVFTFLENGETPLQPLTFADLDARARRFARRLRATLASGSRVVVMLPAGYAFLEALFGCFYAACVPIPVAVLRKRDLDFPHRRTSDDTPLVEKIARDADAAAMITTAELSRMLREAESAPHLRASAICHILPDAPHESAGEAEAPGPDELPPPDPQALAYLQYTSGSTGDPRGVMVSHANVMAAVRGSAAAFSIGERSRFVSWLPHYHDMGLVGSILQTVYSGAQCWIMSPQAFVAKPERWLAAISRFAATISGGPNFAYDLCVRSAAHRAHAFRLHDWECAYNGSEPVRLETLEKFAAAFAPSGFRPESFRPCYGLAEATLQVSGGPLGRVPAVRTLSGGKTAGTDLARVSVSCGRPVEGALVCIVDPKTLAPVPDGAVGEIWVSAPQVGAGYWGKPVASREVFAARPAGVPDGPVFLRTGDAGMLVDGEVYVLGRYKDAIILNGVNHQPEPIEATTVLAGSTHRLNTAAAVGVPLDGRERLVIVAELGGRTVPAAAALAELCRDVRAAIHRTHDLAVHTLVIVPYLSLPRTTSGKVRRHKVRQLFLGGRLSVVYADGALPAPHAGADTARGEQKRRTRARSKIA
ncbi:MAG TPA: fatty acyl-AMP ligase [Burkholderiales bacterium]